MKECPNCGARNDSVVLARVAGMNDRSLFVGLWCPSCRGIFEEPTETALLRDMMATKKIQPCRVPNCYRLPTPHEAHPGIVSD